MNLYETIRAHKHSLFTTTIATAGACVLYERGVPSHTVAAAASVVPLFSLAHAYFSHPRATVNSTQVTTPPLESRAAYVHARAQATAVGFVLGAAACTFFSR